MIGDKVVRKLISPVKFSLKVSTNPHVPDEVDIKASLSLGKLESFDQYQRPLSKESSNQEIPIITNLSQSYKLPMNPACYGFSSFDIDYNPSGYISLSFVPQPEIPEQVCTPLYSRAFMIEFAKNMQKNLQAKEAVVVEKKEEL